MWWSYDETIRKGLVGGKTLVRVDADVKSSTEAVGLALEVSSTRFDKVDDAESNGLKGQELVYILWVDELKLIWGIDLHRQHSQPGEELKRQAGQ